MIATRTEFLVLFTDSIGGVHAVTVIARNKSPSLDFIRVRVENKITPEQRFRWFSENQPLTNDNIISIEREKVKYFISDSEVFKRGKQTIVETEIIYKKGEKL